MRWKISSNTTVFYCIALYLYTEMTGWFYNILIIVPGTVWTASAHIITAVIGSGVLSLAWSTAQLGWVVGPLTLMIFALITYYTSSLLADCYRSGDQLTGKRNYTYMDAVAAYLGTTYFLCAPVMSSQLSKRFVFWISTVKMMPVDRVWCRSMASPVLWCFPVC